jgi:hypothetical protein
MYIKKKKKLMLDINFWAKALINSDKLTE